ncbi:MAG: DUF3575 domain-containing protein [Bacteroidales bacterium]|jgi:hypothetical protein|nr:DUF3575 domain-containing protein [Bacteroidales bacterium]
MKKIHVILLTLFTSFIINGFAQVEDGLEQKYNLTGGTFVKIDSMSSDQISLWPELYATYESNMSEHLTGYFRLNVIIPTSINIKLNPEYEDGIEKHSAKGFGINLGAKYYIREAFHGFYAGPFISYYRYNHTYKYSAFLNEEEYSITSVRGSFIIGYQHISESGFVFDVYLGAMLDHKYYEKFTSTFNTIALGSANFIKPDMGISFGYHF